MESPSSRVIKGMPDPPTYGNGAKGAGLNDGRRDGKPVGWFHVDFVNDARAEECFR